MLPTAAFRGMWVWAMTEIYRGVFERIEREPARVLSERRVGLPRWKKAWVAMRC